MGRSFVSGNLIRLGQLGNLFLQPFQPRPEFGHILLLAENLLIQLPDGFILHRREGFQLNDSFFHGLERTKICRIGELFNHLLR